MQLLGSGSHSGSLFTAIDVQLLGSGSHSGSLFIDMCNFWVVGHIVGHFSQLCSIFG